MNLPRSDRSAELKSPLLPDIWQSVVTDDGATDRGAIGVTGGAMPPDAVGAGSGERLGLGVDGFPDPGTVMAWKHSASVTEVGHWTGINALVCVRSSGGC
jgi:hypothetical protein